MKSFYKILRGHDPDSGIELALSIEGKVLAVARASRDAVDDMQRLLGLDREAIEASLLEALEAHLRQELERVTLDHIQEDPERELIFHARYIYNDEQGALDAGLATYDMAENVVTPEDLPPIVRNKMRREVHRMLTAPGSAARALVEIHD